MFGKLLILVGLVVNPGWLSSSNHQFFLRCICCSFQGRVHRPEKKNMWEITKNWHRRCLFHRISVSGLLIAGATLILVLVVQNTGALIFRSSWSLATIVSPPNESLSWDVPKFLPGNPRPRKWTPGNCHTENPSLKKGDEHHLNVMAVGFPPFLCNVSDRWMTFGCLPCST